MRLKLRSKRSIGAVRKTRHQMKCIMKHFKKRHKAAKTLIKQRFLQESASGEAVFDNVSDTVTIIFVYKELQVYKYKNQ